MDTLVWVIEHQGRTAMVSEDGRVDGDDDLAAALRRRLREPVAVRRHGTLVGADTGADDVIMLTPGDGRYVAARVRVLCAGDEGFAIIEATWRDAAAPSGTDRHSDGDVSSSSR